MKKEEFYYEVHVFVNRNEGYGKPVKSNKKLNDDEVIKLAVELDIITQDEADMVDYVEPLTEEEFNN